jgi:hypothetical protein
MWGEQRWWLLLAYAIGVASLAGRWRDQPRLLWPLGLGVGAVLLLLVTGWDEPFMVWMGHGAQLIVAAIFLFRACTGVAEVYPGERWLYGVVGWCLLGHAMGLCWSLLYDPAFQHSYLMGKRGIDNDFVRLAQEHLGMGIRSVAWSNLLLALLVPVGVALAARWWLRRRPA